MLIKQVVLDGIVAGHLDLAFRRWKKPTVKDGGTLTTAVGVLDVRSIDQVSMRSITASDAARAGYDTRAALLAELTSGREGDVYRIELRFAGADPRIELRSSTELNDDELEDVLDKLERLDGRSKRGPWTLSTLELLVRHPHVRAPDLAIGQGLETAVFKADVRKLKTLGLTISHSPGYEVSPRGEVVLAAWRLRSTRGNKARE